MSHDDMKEDFEDGELPEDGEICDDEDDGEQRSSRDSKTTSAKPSASRSSHSEPAAPVSAQQPPAAVNGSSGRDSRERVERQERSERSERPRRFEHGSPPTRDPDPFGPHSDEPGNEYFGNGGDKDYRSAAPAPAEEEHFSDTDYRMSRRRRHSPGPDDADFDGRKRPFYGRGGYRGGMGGGFRNGQKQRFQTEHQICKFFREGFCRDGDNCSYSHQAEDSLRRPVLCNFYANSFCKKGLQCLMLHGEFPCKDFHKGHCKNDQCRFSHVAPTDYTRPIIEKLLADDGGRHQPATYRQNPVANAAAAAAAANVMPRRRVLLPGGPNLNAASPPHAPVIHAPVPQAGHMNGGQLPPPQVVVPTIQRNPPMYPPVGSGGYFNAAPRPEQVQGLPPPRTIEPPRLSTHMAMQQQNQMPGRSMPLHGQQANQYQGMGQHHQPQVIERKEPTPPPFNLEAMLNKLANGGISQSTSNNYDESPASPPTMGRSSRGMPVTVIPETLQVEWKNVRVRKCIPYSNVENVDKIPTSDPRKAKAIAKQFDAYSSILGSGRAVSDPRLRAQDKSSDSVPRQQNAMAFSSWMPQIS